MRKNPPEDCARDLHEPSSAASMKESRDEDDKCAFNSFPTSLEGLQIQQYYDAASSVGSSEANE